ncbi:MAG: hypothetical protein ACD_72C00420G0003 [uncultured bacterium]|uniref:Guanylate kinase n=1 Tax=Candidatus Magasanikbacteria bacterium RIFOXYD2_FULL_36_9 TaxID=1798707 RepID=A0A1F6P184_9BACT|nr:MAG: hypothetical protein ACD_72C00420G0003 [uncultured bacterium]OGH89917.1 MAG: guanylate kinase [Candidatus Magasanikbacteria bacterium RIFOXYD2_FULL_36_9]
MSSTGNLIIISSPSGGGKDAIISALLKRFDSSAKLITTTTRTPRPDDIDGTTYYFINKSTFEDKIKSHEIVEYNLYTGNYYGITKTELVNKLNNFQIVFTNIDIHGRRNLVDAGFKILSIFLLPENLEDLKLRISRRGGLSETEIDQRLETAKEEITSANEYDFQVVNKNGKMSETVDSVAKIITEHLST